MSTAGKAAALAAFMPIIQVSLPAAISYDGSNKIQMMLAVISALTMLIGNISALVQKDVKRMLAFSSVAHAGYLLMGLVAANPEGRSGIMFYSASYLFMQIGSFIILSVLERSGQTNHSLESFNGLSKKYPILAALMSIFMFSLAGIPPFAGFFGKYYLFTAAIHANFTWLTIVAVVSSVISVYFYIGLIVNMYFKESQEQEHESQPGLAAISLVLSTAGIIILGLLPSAVLSIAQASFGNH
jgi:NADH-quinone oxidoreductase subunit N